MWKTKKQRKSMIMIERRAFCLSVFLVVDQWTESLEHTSVSGPIINQNREITGRKELMWSIYHTLYSHNGISLVLEHCIVSKGF